MISQSSADRCSQSVAVTVNTHCTQLLYVPYMFSDPTFHKNVVQNVNVDIVVLSRCKHLF